MTQQDALRTWEVHVSLNELIFASWHFKWKSDTLSSLWFRIPFFSHLVVTSDSVCLSMELWKESLHSDGKLFYHNQQNEQLPLNSNH